MLLSILIIVNMGAIYYGSSIESTTSGNMTKEIAVNIYAHAEIKKPENKKPDAQCRVNKFSAFEIKKRENF